MKETSRLSPDHNYSHSASATISCPPHFIDSAFGDQLVLVKYVISRLGPKVAVELITQDWRYEQVRDKIMVSTRAITSSRLQNCAITPG